MNYMKIEKVSLTELTMPRFHSHIFYEIYFLYKGRRTFFFENSFYELEGPIILIVPPHTVHKTEGSAFERFNIYVTPEFLNDFERDILDEKALSIISLTNHESAALQNILNESIDLDPHDKNFEYIEKAKFSYFMLMLNKLGTKLSPPTLAWNTSAPPIAFKVISYLNKNFHEKITLDYIAEKFFIAKPTLIYNFNKYLNTTPMDYLLNLRLVKAKELLASSTQSIEEISDACGFSTPNYFGLIFKKKEGMSPSLYRKNNQVLL